MAYQTSALYKEAINQPAKTTKVTGQITTLSGATIPLVNDDIVTGSLYVTNQCTKNDSFELGSVFSAESGFEIKTEIDRHSLYDAEVKLSFHIKLSSGVFEEVPLGVFFVNEAIRVGSKVSIKALDGITKLDKDVDESTTGTPFELLTLASVKCGVVLSQTKEEVDALVNGTKQLTVSPSRVGTFRDLVAFIGRVTCTFGHFDRMGKLRLTPFNTVVSKVILEKTRVSSKFSDFETYFSGVSSSFIFDSAYKQYSAMNEGDGLTYKMGNNPLVQGLDTTNQETLDSIFSSLSQIRYVPSDISFNGDPSVDLGDMLETTDRKGNVIRMLTTFYKWMYRGKHQIRSAGGNPKLLSQEDKDKKELEKMQSSIASKTVSIYSFTNASPIVVKGGTTAFDMKEATKISFSINDDSLALFVSTITLEMDVDGIVEFDIFINRVKLENSTVSQYCNKGVNTITFMNYIDCKKSKLYTLVVYARTVNCDSEIRMIKAITQTNANAKEATISAYESLVSALKTETELPIATLDDTINYEEVLPLTTLATMTVQPYKVKSVLYAQGISALSIDWDGTLNLSDEVGFERLSSQLTANTIIDTFSVETALPDTTTISELISLVQLAGTAMDIV